MARATSALEEATRERAFPAPARRTPARPHAAFLHLFHAVKAMNRDDAPFMVQVLAASHGEGASAVAAGFAEAAAAQWGGSVLLIDCAASALSASPSGASFKPAPQSLAEVFARKGGLHGGLQSALQFAAQPAPNGAGVVLARLTAAEGAFSRLDLGDLGRLLDAARQVFPIIVLDCPPPAEAPEALALGRHCDGTLLVVGAGAASRSLVAQTRADVERSGGQVLGCVLNKARSFTPRWLARRL